MLVLSTLALTLKNTEGVFVTVFLLSFLSTFTS